MNSWEEYEATQRNYAEMLVEAQKIHPDMKLRLTGINQTEWEMYMPTPFIEKHELSAVFKGTRAWEMYEERDSGYDNSLQRYRHKNGYDGIPLEGVAEYVNLIQEQQDWARPVQERLHAENGSDIPEDEWSHVSNEKFSAYQETQRQVNKLMQAQFEGKWAEWRKKWDF